MKTKEFKQLSLSQLKGNWGAVILALLLVMIVSAAVGAVVNIPSIINGTTLQEAADRLDYAAILRLLPFSAIGGIIVLAVSAAFSYGVSKYMLVLVRTGKPELGYAFSGFSNGFGTVVRSFVLALLVNIFIFLWSLLFVIPGIIASYRYALVYYIIADDDSISPIDAIRKSKQMMVGHKWNLFVLELSFLGWILLSIITCGIGFIFLAPYIEAAFANFYEYVRGISEGSKNAA